MTAAPAFTAPPPQRPARRPALPATRTAHPAAAIAPGQACGDGRRPGRANKFSSIDPLLCRIGLVVLIVAAGVAVTVYLLLRLLPADIGAGPGLWNITAEVRHMITALFHHL
jgi:hypothetical protein